MRAPSKPDDSEKTIIIIIIPFIFAFWQDDGSPTFTEVDQ